MKKLLVSMLMALVCSPVAAQTLDRIPGLGKDRENLTDELLKIRYEAMLESQEFSLLRRADAERAPARIFDPAIAAIILKASSDHAVPASLIRAVGFVESYGKHDAVSPTGPVGWGQFTKAKAEEVGLRIRTVSRKVGVTKTECRGKGKRRTCREVKRTITVRDRFDDRLDFAKAIQAVALSLARGHRTFGRWDFAVQEHHNGNGRIRKMLSIYTGQKVTNDNAAQIIRQHQITFTKLYFSNTPYFRTELYQYLLDIPDYGSTYSFRVLQAERLLNQYQSSPRLYSARFDMYRSHFKPDLVPTTRMWYFFRPEEVGRMRFANLKAIQDAAAAGRLVSLPQPWDKFGYLPRLSGTSPIAKKDLPNQNEYLRAEIPTIGLLLYVMNELKILQGSKFLPYETNSLVRTTQTQERLLDDPGTQASAGLPTHTWGKAVDFPVLGMSKNRVRDLHFILTELDSYGLISFNAEHQLVGKGRKKKKILLTYHMVPHPDAAARFEQVYAQAVGHKVVVTTLQQH
jgi:hypothetical protein